MPDQPNAPAGDQKHPPSAVVSFLGKFTVLFGAVRELWIVLALAGLGNVAYRLVNFTLTLWLSSDLGFSDVRAGVAVTIWSAGLTLIIVLVGSLTDALGLRKTFLLAFGLCILSRVFLTFTTLKWVALGGGLVLLAFGEGMTTPAKVAALRRYTTTAQRSIAFSVFYALMNAGFFLAVYISDALRAGLGEHGQFRMPGLGLPLEHLPDKLPRQFGPIGAEPGPGLFLAAGGSGSHRPGSNHYRGKAQISRGEASCGRWDGRSATPCARPRGFSRDCGGNPASTSSWPSWDSRRSSR